MKNAPISNDLGLFRTLKTDPAKGDFDQLLANFFPMSAEGVRKNMLENVLGVVNGTSKKMSSAVGRARSLPYFAK